MTLVHSPTTRSESLSAVAEACRNSTGATPGASPPPIAPKPRKAAHRSKERFAKDQGKDEAQRTRAWFGPKRHDPNILAIVTIALLVLILITVVAAVVRNELEIFKVIGWALLSTLTPIVGYLIGQHEAAERLDSWDSLSRRPLSEFRRART